MINHKGKRVDKDGKDQHRLQTSGNLSRCKIKIKKTVSDDNQQISQHTREQKLTAWKTNKTKTN